MSEVKLTIPGKTEITVNHEQAVKIVIEYLRKHLEPSHTDFGYDVYVNTVLDQHCQKAYNLQHHNSEKVIKDLSPLFIDACWELCRRGILRPYTHDVTGQGTTQGAGFSITAPGKKWLQEDELDDYVPTEPYQFAKMLEPYTIVFGNGFQERAQEAVRCYNAHAFLACCVMSGAAGETILNKIADKLKIKRKEYEPITATRQKIFDNLTSDRTKEYLMAFSDIVKYLRDEGMHHENWETKPEKAYMSLAMLLRLAIFTKGEWFKES